MADEVGQGDRKQEEKKEVPDVKRTSSIPKKKGPSKLGISSKMSLKKDGSITTTPSDASSSSMAMKRQSDMDKLTKGPKYQNTYRLDSKKPFKPDEVYKIIETIILREVEYFPNYDMFGATKFIQGIAADVRSSVRLMNYDRYKICVFIYLGEKKFQGFQAAFRALWDHERDGWATYFYQCRTYFLSCTCYGLYHD